MLKSTFQWITTLSLTMGGVSIFIRLAVVAYRFNEIWSMTDTRQYAMTRSKVKVAEVRNSRKWPF